MGRHANRRGRRRGRSQFRRRVPKAFVPLDDGTTGDNTTPDNQLADPSSDDAQLVGASLSLSSVPGSTWFWSLSFPASVHVFYNQYTTLTPLTSGTQYGELPPTAGGAPASGSGMTVNLLVQGISNDSGAAIQAFLVPETIPPNTTQNGAPPTTKVTAVVASLAEPRRDEQWSSCAVLTGADKQTGLYLPQSHLSAAYYVQSPNSYWAGYLCSILLTGPRTRAGHRSCLTFLIGW